MEPVGATESRADDEWLPFESKPAYTVDAAVLWLAPVVLPLLALAFVPVGGFHTRWICCAAAMAGAAYALATTPTRICVDHKAVVIVCPLFRYRISIARITYLRPAGVLDALLLPGPRFSTSFSRRLIEICCRAASHNVLVAPRDAYGFYCAVAEAQRLAHPTTSPHPGHGIASTLPHSLACA
ncbi:uncharacterized protein AMSG_04821 [Thecamonas trahens ATCC 50062]|uniref:Uncharacterized protein n=1 Tax=Thecamonas trahens ATCC 50062 TaxID=461836 RepID=A0A0L0D7K8_THETB|nr:hypothetical protein AMSG_04821 [Thecamonas trahens ATCC 50062]KNC48372.1 hypothetical protein AMSG_04821 [Thecamonas trahens ATCC 50062]|eukprot:XP_013758492.1 hypothetical protein AMSG_04821 [Thecamonas trahens ATCC 50062]